MWIVRAPSLIGTLWKIIYQQLWTLQGRNWRHASHFSFSALMVCVCSCKSFVCCWCNWQITLATVWKNYEVYVCWVITKKQQEEHFFFLWVEKKCNYILDLQCSSYCQFNQQYQALLRWVHMVLALKDSRWFFWGTGEDISVCVCLAILLSCFDSTGMFISLKILYA